jgi:hypothetical protein
MRHREIDNPAPQVKALAAFLIRRHSHELRSIALFPDPKLHYPLYVEYIYTYKNPFSKLIIFFYCLSLNSHSLYISVLQSYWTRAHLSRHRSSPNPPCTCGFSMMLLLFRLMYAIAMQNCLDFYVKVCI